MMGWEDRMERIIRSAIRSDLGARVARPTCGLTVRTRHYPDVVVIALAGELDIAGAEPVRDTLTCAMRAPRRRLIVDLGGLTFIDSSGLHTIVDAFTRCRFAGPVLTIHPGPWNVQRVFELTNTIDDLPFASVR